ncbi:MAG TPA: FliM/FliN family flagellar motor switch protein [Gemmatimonadaceae bacterium]|nr:FliM/FliN family flagellar motor switch protein [Gemmatimonadaceae bacterium]
MANDTLNQSEIDRLLGGGGGSALDFAASGRRPAVTQPEVQRYDFRRPHRISKDRLRTIEAMYERMVKNLESYLMSRVRGQVEVRLQSVEQFSFGEFTLSLPTPCCSYITDINGKHGLQGVIDFGTDFAFFLVDRLFGGGSAPTVMDRPLTALEQDAVRIVADRAASIVRDVWHEVMPIELSICGFEAAPEILQVCAREDPVLVANIEVSAPNISSLIMICLPFASLEEYFTSADTRRVSSTARSDEELRTQRIQTEKSLRHTSVPVAARLPEFRLSMKDLSQLQPGTVINTGLSAHTLLSVTIAGQQRLVATAGRIGGKLAARIADGRITDNRITGTISTADSDTP